ncbi:MAG: hypothetical protein LBD92_07320 [Oscillospiraceae bacterium]|nr:hypothetical protein [Oscillospiraceae bacterium]
MAKKKGAAPASSGTARKKSASTGATRKRASARDQDVADAFDETVTHDSVSAVTPVPQDADPDGQVTYETETVPPMADAATRDAEQNGRTSTSRRTIASVDKNEWVTLKSNCYGQLTYKSKAGYSFELLEFGATTDIPFGELLIMRNEQPAFFQNGWVVPVSDNAANVIDALQLTRYCKSLETLENFDDIFSLEPDAMRELIAGMPQPMRENAARRARGLIDEGVLDSVRKIEAIETAVGYSLRD